MSPYVVIVSIMGRPSVSGFGCSSLLSGIWCLKVYPKIIGRLFSLSYSITLKLDSGYKAKFSCPFLICRMNKSWELCEGLVGRLSKDFTMEVKVRWLSMEDGANSPRLHMEHAASHLLTSHFPFFLPNKTIILLLKVMCPCDIQCFLQMG